MKQSKKHYLTKIGIIIGAISPATLVASSSDTKSTNAESTLESVIQNLDATPFASLIQTTGGSPSNLASTISQADVIGKLKLASSFARLSEAEKTKLSDSDVAISPENDLGVLEITIENHGTQKVILVHGFKLENVDPTIKFLIKWLNKEWVYYKNGIETLLPSQLANIPFSDSRWRDIFESFFDRVISSKQKQINSNGLTTKQLNDAKLKVATNVNYYITAIKAYDSFGILSLIVKYEKEVKQINISNFKSQKDKLLPSEITKKHLQLYLWAINGWSNKKRKAVSEDLITIIKIDEDSGKLEFNIPIIDKKGVWDASSLRRHKYTISGLNTNAKVLANAIQGLAENALDGNGDETKLPSAITEPNVLDWIKALANINSLTDDQKALLEEGNIGLNDDDSAGTLEVTINGHGEAITFRISGFKTNAKVLANAIQDLAENALDGNGDDTKLPSAITSTNVLDWIKALANINSLTDDQKALLEEGNIGLNDDDSAGTLEVTINDHGEAKTFTISGFKTTTKKAIETDKALFASFGETLTEATDRIDDGDVDKDVLETLSGHKPLPPETAGVTRAFKITTDSSGLAIVTVTFTSGSDRDTIDYEISGFKTTALVEAEAKITTDKNQFADFTQTLDDAVNPLGNGNVNKDTLEALSGHKPLPLETADVTRVFTITTNSAGLATVTVTFTSGSARDTIDYEISGFKTTALVEAEAKIATDKNQFVDFTQTLDDAVNPLGNGNVNKETLEALSGHKPLPLETAGVTRTYNINTNSAGLATVTVAFTSGSARDTIDYEISGFKTTALVEAEAKIATDKNHFADFTQTLDDAVNPLGNGNVNKDTLEALSGHKPLPLETADVTRAFTITTDSAGLATVTVTFTSGSARDTIDYEISGFKTTALVEAEAKIATDKNHFADFTQTLDDAVNPLGNGNVNKDTLEALSGHKPLPLETAGVTRAFTITTDSAGLATVTVTFTSGSARDTIDYEISGFKTTALVEAEAKIATDKNQFADFTQTLDDAVNPLGNGNVNKDTLEDLSGHKPLPLETAGVTRTYNINTNSAGLATVTITFTSGSARDTIDYEISGFKTTALVEAEAKIATDKNQFVDFTQTLDDAVNPLGNGNVNKDTLEALSGHKPLPLETAGVTRAFTITTDSAGLATVTVTFTSGSARDTIDYEISGFKTTALVETEAKIATDKNQFADFTQTLDAGVNRLNNGEVTKETLEALSGHKPLPLETAGVTRTYNINTNSAGLATMTVTFTSGSARDTIDYEISGFKTTALVEAEAKIATDKALFDTFNPTLDAGVNRLNNGEVTKETLEALSGHGSLPEATASVTRTYNINTNSAGLATVTVTFTSGSARDTIYYEISGFKTTALVEAEAKIATDKNQFVDFTQTLDDAVNPLGNGNVNKETLEALSGHKPLPLETAGVTRAFTITTDSAGLATVTVTFTSGSARDTIDYEISGFKTTALVEAEAKIATDKNQFVDFTQTLDDAVNPLGNGNVNKETLEALSGHKPLPLETAGVTRTYNINTNSAGLATVTVAFTSGSARDTIDYEISGFKTTALVEAEAKIATDKNHFADFTQTLDDAVNPLGNGNVNKETLEALSGHKPLPLETAGVTRTYNINTNSAGLATVTVTFTSGSARDTIDYEISGFKTTALVEAEAKIATDKNQFVDFTQTLDDAVNPLGNGNVNKDTLESLSGHKPLPLETAGVTRVFTITTNSAGLATVTVTFTSGSARDTIDYEISGFKTTALVEAEAKIATDKNQFVDFTQTLDDAVNPLGNGNVNKETLEALSGHKPLPLETAGVTRTYNINTNSAGLATVTVTFTSGSARDTIDYEISGFKTTALVEAEAKIATDKNHFADFTQTLDDAVNPLGNGNVNKDTLEALSGHKPLPLETADVTRVFTITTNSAGLATVTVTFTSGSARDTIDYEISGFKTTALVEAEAKIATDKNQFADFTQTLDDAVNPLGNGNVNKDTLESLSGHKPLPLETAGVTRVFTITTNSAGLATVTVTFTSGSARDTIDYEISGFKTTALVEAEAKIATDKALFDTFNPTLDAGVNRLNNGEVTKETLEALSGHGSLPEATASVTRTYNINTNSAGLATVTVTFTSGSARDTIDYEISGFKTTALVEAEAKIATDKNQFVDFTQTLDDAVNPLGNGNVNKDTLEALSGHKPLPLETAGVTRAFTITTDSAGLATVTVTFTSGSARDTIDYEISGFKTAAQTANEKALIDAIKILANNALDGLGNSDRLPDEINIKDVLDALKGLSTISVLSNTQQDLLVEDDIALVANNGGGTLEVTINNHGGAKTLTISGFKTNSKALEDAIQGLAEDALASNGDASKLPSEITETSVLGWIKALAAINSLTNAQKALLIEGNIALNDDDNAGTLEVTINGHGSAKEFNEIEGFQTTTKKAIETDKALFDTFNPTLDDRVNRLEDGPVSEETLEGLGGHSSLPEATASVTRTYNINTNSDGEATVTVTFVSGADRGTIDYEIIGFKTTAQTNLEAINNAIQGLEENALNGLANTNTFAGDINASAVIDHIKALPAISALSPAQQALLLENDIQLIANNGDGNLRVTIARHGEDKIFTITGFKQDTGETLASDSDDDSEALSLPALIGIIAGSIVGLGLGGYLIYYLIKKRK